MELNALIQLGLIVVISAISWFLKELHSEFKDVKKDLEHVKTKTQLIEQKSTSDISELTKITEMHIISLNATVDKQAQNIEELTRQIMKLTAKIGNN